MFRYRDGQTLIEYTILLVVVIAMLVVMKNYVKRAFQGRWKESVDGLGQQYDPKQANARIRHMIQTNSSTSVSSLFAQSGGTSGGRTKRVDSVNTVEERTGTMRLDNY